MQRALVQIVRLSECPNVIWHSIPNEGARSARFGAELKAMGLKPGVADMIFVIDGKAHYLELKSSTGRLTDTQRLFAADCRAAQIPHGVAYSLDEAVDLLTAWGAIEKISVAA
jgi:hypothetical protein